MSTPIGPDLGRARLVAQGLVQRPYARPADAVAAFGAMQGQDLPGVVASAALRSRAAAADVIEDLDAGRIVRGYPMRGTVFLVASDDLRWMSELCNPVALRAAQKRRGSLGLDDHMVQAARDAALSALSAAPRGLARAELFARWEAVGTPTDHGRGYHVLAHLIGSGALCYGPWNGSEQNIVATSTWLPEASSLEARFGGDPVAATAELLRRYLTTHGPGTLRDFAWWTKLPLRQIRAAWAGIAGEFEADPATEQIWRPGLLDELRQSTDDVARPLLLPGFDEFILGYPDRLFAMTADHHARLVPGNNGVFKRAIVVDGRVAGLWKRGGTARRRRLELDPFVPLDDATVQALDEAFGAFPFAGA